MSELVVQEEVFDQEALDKSLEFDSLRPYSDTVAHYFILKRVGYQKIAVCPICTAYVDNPSVHWEDHRRITKAIQFLGGQEV